MSLTQIAMLLQISGFIIAGVFAGILLERGAIGKLADKVNNWTQSTADTLDKNFPLPTRKAFNRATYNLIYAIILEADVALIVVGWLNNLWVFSIAGLIFILAFFTPAVLMLLYSKNRLETAKGLAIQLFILIITIPMLLFTAGITLLRLMMRWLAGNDMLKKVFLVFGTVMLLAGLILEFVATL